LFGDVIYRVIIGLYVAFVGGVLRDSDEINITVFFDG
jgi:hypothetical protein